MIWKTKNNLQCDLGTMGNIKEFMLLKMTKNGCDFIMSLPKTHQRQIIQMSLWLDFSCKLEAMFYSITRDIMNPN